MKCPCLLVRVGEMPHDAGRANPHTASADRDPFEITCRNHPVNCRPGNRKVVGNPIDGPGSKVLGAAAIIVIKRNTHNCTFILPHLRLRRVIEGHARTSRAHPP